MRRLIYVPIVHTEADMGSISDSLKDKYIQKYGQNTWFDRVNKIDAMWQGIEKRLDELDLSYGSVKIYQDGLPNCGIEKKIVDDIAKRGSKNYQLIVKLLDKGAQLIGTEDSGLLIEEYNAIRESIKHTQETDKNIKDRYKIEAEKHLSVRDKYISKRIDETLKEGETGILFIGAMHKVNETLPENIEIFSLA